MLAPKQQQIVDALEAANGALCLAVLAQALGRSQNLLRQAVGRMQHEGLVQLTGRGAGLVVALTDRASGPQHG